MTSRDGHTHFLTTPVRNFPGYAGDVCLRILATSVITQRDGRYRKLRALAHDGREYRGWVNSDAQNPMIVPRSGPLRITLFVDGKRVSFAYVGQTPDVAQLTDAPHPVNTPPARPSTQASAEELWCHVNAIIKSVAIADDSDVSRVRKAVGLLFHSEAATNKVALDVLARANALIDSLSRPRAA